MPNELQYAIQTDLSASNRYQTYENQNLIGLKWFVIRRKSSYADTGFTECFPQSATKIHELIQNYRHTSDPEC